MLKKIYNKLFYNPYKVAKNNTSIQVDSSAILLKSCQFIVGSPSPKKSILIGQDSMLGCTFVFESDQGSIEIGKSSYISAGTTLISRSQIKIGSNVTIAWGCTIYDHNSHSLDFAERRNDISRQNKAFREGQDFIATKNWDVVKSAPIIIENDVWIGFNCILLKGIRVGEGAIISAGSVVRNDVEPWTVVAGNPAQIIKRLK